VKTTRKIVGSAVLAKARARRHRAQAILKALAAAGVNELRIALACGVSWRTIYRWREGAAPRVKAFKKLEAMAKARGIL